MPLIQAAQRQSMAQTGAYLDLLTDAPTPTRVRFAEVSGAAVRGGVPLDEVYMRPVVAARLQYAKTKLVEAAVSYGLERLLSNAELDQQLTVNHTQARVYESRGVKYLRRIASSGACDYCQAAATRSYYNARELQPLHSRCRCYTAPVRTPGGSAPDATVVPVSRDPEVGPVFAGKRKGGPPLKISDAERISMKKAQLSGYEKTLAEGGGTDWTRQKAAELRAEIGN